MSESHKTIQQELDTVRFALSQWENLEQFKIETVSFGRNPDTGKTQAVVILNVNHPIMAFPGMAISVIPNELRKD